MGFESYERLPSISSHSMAVLRLNNTKPIRGRTPVHYPLSYERRDTQFGIRMVGDEASVPHPSTDYYEPCPNAKAGDVELILYRSPVVTFHDPNNQSQDPNNQSQDPNNQSQTPSHEFTIYSGTYGRWSVADCYFIGNVLSRYFRMPRTTLGLLVLETHGGRRFTIEPKGYVRFAYDEEKRTVEPVNAERPTTLRINRKAANNVRARYGEFYRYMKGMIGVRKELHEERWYNWQSGEDVITQEYRITLSADELCSVVPTEIAKVIGQYESIKFVDKYTRNSPLRKPAKLTTTFYHDPQDKTWKSKETTQPYNDWLAVTEEILALMSAPADDPEQHDKFRRAFVWVAFYASGHPFRTDTPTLVAPEDFTDTANGILFRYHSEEVFERVPVKENGVPNRKYEEWVTREKA